MGTAATKAKRKYNKKNYVQCNMSLTQDLMRKFEFAKNMKGYESYPQTLEAALYALVAPGSPPPKWEKIIKTKDDYIAQLEAENRELAKQLELEKKICK